MPSTRAHSHALRGFTPSRLARSHALLGLRAAPHDVGWDLPWQKARRRTSRSGTCGTPWARFGRGSASARPRVYVVGAYVFPPRRSHAICFTRAQGVSMYKMGLGRGKGWKGGGKGQMHVAFTPIAAPRAAHKRVGASPRTPCFST